MVHPYVEQYLISQSAGPFDSTAPAADFALMGIYQQWVPSVPHLFTFAAAIGEPCLLFANATLMQARCQCVLTVI